MEKDIPTVGFQGESGAYSEKAVQLYFSEVISRSYRSFSDLFLAIENDQIDLVILPIENSIEGSVIESYELLLKSDLSVVGEINVKVDHCLISHHNTKKEDIDVIYSHTQALGQCNSYLKNMGCDAIATYDTAGSVKMIKEKNMKSTVVPNRNAIFMSFVYAYSLSLNKQLKAPIEISLGVHSGDHDIYPDCRIEFYNKIFEAFRLGNWDTERINLYLPYVTLNKSEIIKDAINSCNNLNLDLKSIFLGKK